MRYFLSLCLPLCFSFQLAQLPSHSTFLKAVSTPAKSGYEPKWKKKETIASTGLSHRDKGLVGTVSVVFRTGESNITTTASPGQPLRDVASQAGQFINYGCGKGVCGQCECKVGTEWIRPCSTAVPDTVDDYIIDMPSLSSKSVSSGKFYSIRSFIRGFVNNALGMVGFVKARRAAKANWTERQEYEDRIRVRTAEIRAERLAREAELERLKP